MKNLYVRLNEALEKMTSKQRDKFYESRSNGAPVEVQLNAAEAILSGKVKESAPVRKHNGAGDNGHVLFTESDGGRITETPSKGDEVLFKHLSISESDQRKLNNLPPVGSPNLTPTQLREYRFLRSIRLSESDALKGAQKVA